MLMLQIMNNVHERLPAVAFDEELGLLKQRASFEDSRKVQTCAWFGTVISKGPFRLLWVRQWVVVSAFVICGAAD